MFMVVNVCRFVEYEGFFNSFKPVEFSAGPLKVRQLRMKVGRRVLKIGNMRIPLYHSLFSQEALRKCIWCTVLSVLGTHHTFSLPVFSYIELSITGVAS